MKIKNLADFPQQLEDGRVIGATGTKEDTREYALEELAKEDKKRVKNGLLTVVEEVEANTVETEKNETLTKVKTGGKNSGN